VQLTHGPGRLQGSPDWSPDGRRIAFDSQDADGRWDIWTIELDGGPPRRLTHHAEDENMPHWSRDGRFVYYGVRRNGTIGISRVRLDGVEEQVMSTEARSTTQLTVQESADGRTLYYVTGFTSPLFARPMAGGPSRKLVECVRGPKGFVVAAQSVYYADCGPQPAAPGPPQARLHRLDPGSGDDRILGTLERYRGSLSVSRDEKTILYSSLMRIGSDLMLIEGFR
jgi:Tol biopolymer transport system component